MLSLFTGVVDARCDAEMLWEGASKCGELKLHVWLHQDVRLAFPSGLSSLLEPLYEYEWCASRGRVREGRCLQPDYLPT